MDNRLHHLDLLRGSMMFLGVLVHSSHADYGGGDYEIIRFLSDSFRMACFFIISGYFSALIFERKGGAGFYFSRLPLLLIPASFCTIFLVPITNHWMQSYYAIEDSSAKFISGWMGHAWFLYALCLYTLATPLLIIALKRLPAIRATNTKKTTLLLLCFALLVMGSIVSVKAVDKFGHLIPLIDNIGLLLSSGLTYFPFFVLGLNMYLDAHLFTLSHKHLILWLSVSVACIFYRHSLSYQEITSTAQHILVMSVDYMTAIAISFSLFSLTSRFLKKPNVIVRTISDSSYTVYILHYFFIAIILLLAQKLALAIHERIIYAFITATITGVLVHILLVRRYWLISLIVNGRTPKHWAEMLTTSTKPDIKMPP